MQVQEDRDVEEGALGSVSPPIPPSPALHAVRLLFDRHHVPDRRRSKTLQEVLGLSYPAAHRRMTGDVPWTLEDLEQVAAHYGETLSDLFHAVHHSEAVSATFESGGFRSPCRAWLGSPTDPAHPTPLVAWQTAGAGWTVSPAAGVTRPTVSVREVLLQPMSQRRTRLAVLDDDEGLAQTLRAAFTALGFQADAFTSPDPLLAASRSEPYDAYVLDWLLGHQTAEALCRALRAEDPSAVLILQTGQLANEQVNEDDLLRTVRDLRMEPVEKPVRPSFLAATVERHLAQKAQSAQSVK